MMQQQENDTDYVTGEGSTTTIYQSNHYDSSSTNDTRTRRQQSTFWNSIWQGSKNMLSSSSSPTITSNERLHFLPDYTEHPKPLIIRHHKTLPAIPPTDDTIPPEDEENEITFFHDFIAGGVAGSASVIVGHPFDT